MEAMSLAAALVREGLLKEDTLEAVADEVGQPFVPLWTRLLEGNSLDEAAFLRFAAARLGVPFWDQVPEVAHDDELARHFSFGWLRRQPVLPVRTRHGVALLVADPAALPLVQDVALTLNEPVHPVLCPKKTILEAVQKIFGGDEHASDATNDVLDALDSGAADILAPFEDDKVNDLLEESDDAPFIKLVNLVIAQAVKARASDIHFEPYQDAFRVRFRLDGVLYDRHTLSRRYHAAITSRIKIMARLNIAEKRLPQDGRIALALGNRQVDLRVSSLPTAFGERIVLRLLEKNARVLSLEELGLAADDTASLKETISLPNGIILVTGPTGSGKTTTLYAALSHINTPDKNILTIEDPIEYQIPGLGQMQVNSKIDLSFAAGLRTMLRQDPDVILIGEIRDKETADIAIQAALTGHLVFSTLHTNDAPSAVTRLIDMGVEPFLLASVLRSVLAQRLVRILCPHCKEAETVSEETLREFGDDAPALTGRTVYRAVGCKACQNTGFQGRKAIYEMMPVNDEVKQGILRTADAGSLRAVALENGLRTLRRDGCRKAVEGLTSLSEILRTVSQ